jgi:hypothetical protein
MDKQLSATLHLTRPELEEILLEYVKKKLGKPASEVRFEVSAGSDDRFHYQPPSLIGVDVKFFL